MTKAFVDGRIEQYGKNIYYKTNQASEGHLIEMAYISYPNDLKEIINNPDLFARGFVNGLENYLN